MYLKIVKNKIMKIFFLLLLSSYKLNNLTFENMFNYELENVLKEKEKEFKKIESEAKCNVVVFFLLDEKKMAKKSITEIKNDLFHKLNIEDTGKSIIAFEHENPKVQSNKKVKFNLKRMLKKTELKLENFNMEISEISPDNYFGIITEGIIGIKNKKPERTSQKDLFIADNYPINRNFYAKRINDELVIQDKLFNFICLFSNFQMTKPDLEYCSKIFNAEKANFETFFPTSFCCLALKIDDDKIKKFKDLFNDLYNNHENEENILKSKNQNYIYVKPKIYKLDSDSNKTKICLFHDNNQKSIIQIFADIECTCDIKSH